MIAQLCLLLLRAGRITPDPRARRAPSRSPSPACRANGAKGTRLSQDALLRRRGGGRAAGASPKA
eukprot:219248-Alexandrium_andersonii.AAC.1